MTRYGYIGLGQMGSAMAGHLLSTGAGLAVFDLDEGAVATAVEQGATSTGSAAEVASASDVVSICVPAARHIEAVMSGAGGIAEGAHDGLTVLIHSTVHPDTITAMRDVAAPWGVPVHDACVAGGVVAAEQGELVIMAGGVADMAPAVVELLGTYGSKLIDGGPVGAGAAIKAGVNVMTYAQNTAAMASWDIVRGSGADTGALVDAWRHIGMLGEITERYLTLLDIPTEAIVGDLRTFQEINASVSRKDLEVALALSGGDPRIGAVVSALADAVPVVMGVPDFDPEGA